MVIVSAFVHYFCWHFCGLTLFILLLMGSKAAGKTSQL